jgi:REP element-mobilizing transposase RayT
VCIDISERYEINFVEIGNDLDHIHFLVQSVPTITVTRIVTVIKSITAKQIFKKYPQLKKDMWGSSLWTSGYYANTVGMYASKDAIRNYIKNQGHNEKSYSKIYQGQLRFDL